MRQVKKFSARSFQLQPSIMAEIKIGGIKDITALRTKARVVKVKHDLLHIVSQVNQSKTNHKSFSLKSTSLKVALFAHKIINNPAGIPTIFSGTLPLASDFHSHYTRFVFNLNFRRPLIHNNYGASTFTFIASKIWETIPLHLKKLHYYPFSKQCKLYLLNSQSVS